MIQKKKPKMGRPPLPPGERRQASVGFRPTPGIRKKLEAAAKTNGRSVSKEIESRLEGSFVEEGAHHESFGGKAAFERCQMLALVAQYVSADLEKPWTSDHEVFNAVLGAWTVIANGMTEKPLGPLAEALMSNPIVSAQNRGKKFMLDWMTADTNAEEEKS